jgi:SNF2 family DNA or RNA helicase
MNYFDLKKLSRKQLLEMVPNGFKFKLPPWDHQLAAFIAAISEDGFNVWLDLGTGKTKVAIDAVRFIEFCLGRPVRALVICLASAVGNWLDEIKLNSDMDCIAVRPDGSFGETKEQRFRCMEGKGFFVANYESLQHMLTVRKPSRIKIVKGQEKVINKMAHDPTAMRRLMDLGFDALIVDEAHKIKSIDTLNYKIAARIAVDVGVRILLTGTPYGKSLLGIWSQYYIVDYGSTYGSRFTEFRSKYFVDRGYFGPDWKVTRDGRKAIESKLFTKAIRYNEAEIKDMPPKVYRVIGFNLSSEQRKAYDDASNKEGEFTFLENSSMIYRQICSGIIVSTNYLFKSNPKLKLLNDLVESVVDEHKIVIFHQFILESKIIIEMLKKLKVLYCVLNGSTKDKYAEYKKFEKEDKFRVMVAHPLSGGASINLNVARYCIFFSNDHSPINRSQCEKRIHRGEIKDSRFYYDLLANNTVEVSMHAALKRNLDLFSKAMNSKRWKKYLKGELDG